MIIGVEKIELWKIITVQNIPWYVCFALCLLTLPPKELLECSEPNCSSFSLKKTHSLWGEIVFFYNRRWIYVIYAWKIISVIQPWRLRWPTNIRTSNISMTWQNHRVDGSNFRSNIAFEALIYLGSIGILAFQKS